MSRALPATRAEREAMAAELRAKGLKFREIAEEMGVATQTAHHWISDPGGHRLRARKDSYRGCCSECGRPTDGSSGPGRAPTVCINCLTWTREAVLMAFQEWADANVGLPPRCQDCRNSNGALPLEPSVARLFGSWNEGLLAAGFELRCDRRESTYEAIVAAVRTGESVHSIAERFGVTPSNIWRRLRYRGTSVAIERARCQREEVAA